MRKVSSPADVPRRCGNGVNMTHTAQYLVTGAGASSHHAVWQKATEAEHYSGAWHFEGISHGNFVDAPLWAPLAIMRLLRLLFIPAAGPYDPAEAHAVLARAAGRFARGGRAESGEPLRRL